MGRVSFISCTLEQYNSLPEKNDEVLYFISDKGILYKGEKSYSGALADDIVTLIGSGVINMNESLGTGPYTIDFTEEAEEASATKISYNNSVSGLDSVNVQDAIDKINNKLVWEPLS